jgi:hypothetical protein
MRREWSRILAPKPCRISRLAELAHEHDLASLQILLSTQDDANDRSEWLRGAADTALVAAQPLSLPLSTTASSPMKVVEQLTLVPPSSPQMKAKGEATAATDANRHYQLGPALIRA